MKEIDFKWTKHICNFKKKLRMINEYKHTHTHTYIYIYIYIDTHKSISATVYGKLYRKIDSFYHISIRL